MNRNSKNKIWIGLTGLLLVVCIVQLVIILKDKPEQPFESQIEHNFDRFSSFLNHKYKKEKNESHRMFDRFFDDDFFSGKSDPFNEMEKFHRRMEKMMDKDIRSRFNESWNGWLDEKFPAEQADIDVKVKKNDDNFVFTFNIPSLKENNVNIDISKSGITLKGDYLQTVEKKDAKGNIVGKHEMHRAFSKVIPIPEGADYAKATTEHHKNRIIVTMPKLKS